MDIEQKIRLTNRLIRERSVLILFSTALLFSNIFLAYTVMTQDIKTILVPTHFDKKVDVSDNYISNSYLEMMARDFINQILNLTPENYEYVESYVLNIAHPSAYGELKEELRELAKDINTREISLHFNITDMDVNNHSLKVLVKGFLDTRLSSTVVSHEEKQYEILFDYRFGSLLVKGFQEVKNEAE